MHKIEFKSLVIGVICFFCIMVVCYVFFYYSDIRGNVVKLTPEQAEILQEYMEKIYKEKLIEEISE